MRKIDILQREDSEKDQVAIEGISSEVEKLVAANKGPTRLIADLVESGRADLAPLAAERYHHCWISHEAEKRSLEAARLSPIFNTDSKTLVVAPSGELGSQGFSRLCERILASVLRLSPEKVILMKTGIIQYESLNSEIEVLKTDLNCQKVTLVVI